MADWRVIFGIQLGTKTFEKSEKKLRNILELVKKVGFSECLEVNTRIYVDLGQGISLKLNYKFRNSFR